MMRLLKVERGDKGLRGGRVMRKENSYNAVYGQDRVSAAVCENNARAISDVIAVGGTAEF
jgi:hypothetical protein